MVIERPADDYCLRKGLFSSINMTYIYIKIIHKKAVIMLIVDHYEAGTFKTAAIIEEVDVYYTQEFFKRGHFKFSI